MRPAAPYPLEFQNHILANAILADKTGAVLDRLVDGDHITQRDVPVLQRACALLDRLLSGSRELSEDPGTSSRFSAPHAFPGELNSALAVLARLTVTGPSSKTIAKLDKDLKLICSGKQVKSERLRVLEKFFDGLACQYEADLLGRSRHDALVRR